MPFPRCSRVSHTLVLVLLLALATGLLPHHAAPATAAGAAHTYRNPVFAQDFPDPMVLRVGTDYYAHGTATSWEAGDSIFPILHSRGLVHWRYVADAMGPSPNWGSGDWWAPSVIARGGTYYLYFVGKSVTAGVHCLGVAMSRQADRAVQGSWDRGLQRREEGVHRSGPVHRRGRQGVPVPFGG